MNDQPSAMGEVDSSLDDVESIRHRGLSTRYSDGLRMDMNVDTERIHRIRITTRWRGWHDHSTTIRWRDDSMPYDQRSPQRLEASMIQWLADDWMAWRLEQRLSQKADSRTQLDDFMACGRSDGTTTRAEVLATTWGLDDSMACRRGPTIRGLRSGSRNWWCNGWMLWWRDGKESYDTERKISSRRYPLYIR